ncbi:hypothetical protein HYU95_01255 [Candidatus Daviesbacteria bacterium]|nr:hypothetical protein [Candidatus Daviesbacteria bacterium]
MEREFESDLKPRLALTAKHPFAPRVAEIIEKRANGQYCKEIALDLGISEQTVKNQLTDGLNKLEDSTGRRANHGNYIGLLVEHEMMVIKMEGGV